MSMHSYPIGTSGHAWGAAEIDLWRSQQMKQRSYSDHVLSAIELLRGRFDVIRYGEVVYCTESFPFMAVRSLDWQATLPSVLITGGVHGYETSGVQGALQFLDRQALAYAGQVNLLVVPCVSPWAYERIQRWNFDALDPNRSFCTTSLVKESAALMSLIKPLRKQFAMHIDLHETTDTDETEFRPALAARDGKVFEPSPIPDGFYLVDDQANPQPAFQDAIIEAVQRVTHIAGADQKGELIGCKTVSLGVIQYDVSALGLCTGITGAKFTSTTEVYPDSQSATHDQCIAAQVAAICAGIDFVLRQGKQ